MNESEKSNLDLQTIEAKRESNRIFGRWAIYNDGHECPKCGRWLDPLEMCSCINKQLK